MKILGITGSSGSGKTTLSDILRKKDIEVIDCDKVAKELTVPNTAYMESIIKTFGKEILKSDGNLDRKKLGALIYKDKVALEKLNNLTFKYVVEETLLKLIALKEAGKKLACIDAPLLFEAGLDKKCDYIIAVIAKEEIKISRICKRDNVSETVAIQRLNIQKSDEFFKEKADFIVENNFDNTKELEQVLEKILEEIER